MTGGGGLVAGQVFENVHELWEVGAHVTSRGKAIDVASGVLDVTGIDTVIYLDDSASMQGNNLYEGKKVLESLEERLKQTTIIKMRTSASCPQEL